MSYRQNANFISTAAAVLFMFQSGRPTPARAGEAPLIAAILSSELTPYQKARQGLEKTLAGRAILRYTLAKDTETILPQNIRIAVTFGARAAQTALPGKTAHIIAIAPAMLPTPRANREIRIEMLPEAGEMVARIRGIQPELRVLVAFWASETSRDYIKQMTDSGRTAGLEVRSYQTADGSVLSSALRTGVVIGSSIWIPPDPLLINSENFEILRGYSVKNSVPLYVPTEGLAGNGGTVSIAPSFEEIGRLAGEASISLLEGRSVPDNIYPEKLEIVINAASARQCGIDLSGIKIPGFRLIR
ncbi:MAG: hypothetical protein A2X28_01340 [Elusimicrobia bacterium GWA2_56_46]|nr:MAG: hypothetical protein A2X28_01340 [Elusimicrobia bacterium GWA2_56_46]OGR53801.1 MAG: hypothetical protein A2X39_06740 [Elusimicrobia bacterium GWC2_56_31]